MAISTKPFHPLDAENNCRYKVKKKDAPKIDWHKTEQTGAHDWEGYIRVPFDQECTFTIQIDDNGYLEIDGQKVVELTGSNSSKKVEGKKELKQGFHYVKLYHENLAVPEAIAPYRNAEEFVPQMDGKDLELWEIDTPNNLWKTADAQNLLKSYNVVDYLTMPEPGQVWGYIGGWLNKAHLKEISDKVPEIQRSYYNSCSLRMSIALSSFGKDLKDEAGAENIGNEGNFAALGGKKHVLIRAKDMATYLKKLLGEPDYPNSQNEGYSTPQPDDIVVFAGNGHVGMCPGNNISVGSFMVGTIWLLHRSTLEDSKE
ncbi:MAG: T6SS effector amidase Tae4 family protein [Akkermansiaceae bacterium]|nr:T6SS effector amidase Tae4 family protein [Akkermansiaceae bacterium]